MYPVAFVLDVQKVGVLIALDQYDHNAHGQTETDPDQQVGEDNAQNGYHKWHKLFPTQAVHCFEQCWLGQLESYNEQYRRQNR